MSLCSLLRAGPRLRISSAVIARRSSSSPAGRFSHHHDHGYVKSAWLATGGTLMALLACQTNDTWLHADTKSGPKPDLAAMGDLYLWGNNVNHLIPGIQEEVVREPTRIVGFDGMSFRSLALGLTHAAAVDSEGNVHQWGSGYTESSGADQLGSPEKTLEGQNITAVVCGQARTYALSAEGKVFVLGSRGFNRQTFKKVTKSTWISSYEVMEPTSVSLPDELKREEIVSIDAGEKHLVAVTSSGKLLKMEGGKFVLVKGLEGEQVVQAACGSNHTLVLCKSGKVYGFGANNFLQLCTGMYLPSKVHIESPQLIDDPLFHQGGGQVTAIAAGGDTSYVVVNGLKASEVFAFGHGLFGQLGHGRFVHMSGTPVQVQEISGRHYYDEISKKVAPIRVRSVEAGANHAAAILDTKQGTADTLFGDSVFIWGLNKEGQLGTESRANQSQPVAPRGLVPMATSASDNLAQGSDILLLYGTKGKLVQGIATGPETTGVFTIERDRKH